MIVRISRCLNLAFLVLQGGRRKSGTDMDLSISASDHQVAFDRFLVVSVHELHADAALPVAIADFGHQLSVLSADMSASL